MYLLAITFISIHIQEKTLRGNVYKNRVNGYGEDKKLNVFIG